MCGILQVGAYVALLRGNLDAQTWAWFAGGLAGMYVGGDSGEKIASLMMGARASKVLAAVTAPSTSPKKVTEADVDY